MLPSRALVSLLGLALLGCGSLASAPQEPEAPDLVADETPDSPAQRGDASAGGEKDALFPESELGWKYVDAEERKGIADYADAYLGFVAKHRTQRKSAAALLARAIAEGAQAFDASRVHEPGALLYWRDASASSLALLKVGTAPVDEGLQVIIASTDAGLIRLTAKPVYESKGLAMLDTSILGGLELESWLHTPMILQLYIAPSAPGRPATDIAIGDGDNEPVFTIPDLLPHLSGKVQRKTLVDSPERLDAVAGFSSKALATGLKRYGLRLEDFARAEAVLVPAARPSFVGVDRALIAASNHSARAMAFAATSALFASTPERSSLVLLMGHDQRSPSGAGAEEHLANVLPAAIAQHSQEVDALRLRRIMARTEVLLADHLGGDRNRGVVLNARRDDSTPQALRRTLERFRRAGVHTQLVESSGWSQAREVASRNVDTVELGLPITGRGTPFELISTLDLHTAHLACAAWFAPETP